jgi:hypothetical protein
LNEQVTTQFATQRLHLPPPPDSLHVSQPAPFHQLDWQLLGPTARSRTDGTYTLRPHGLITGVSFTLKEIVKLGKKTPNPRAADVPCIHIGILSLFKIILFIAQLLNVGPRYGNLGGPVDILGPHETMPLTLQYLSHSCFGNRLLSVFPDFVDTFGEPVCHEVLCPGGSMMVSSLFSTNMYVNFFG